MNDDTSRTVFAVVVLVILAAYTALGWFVPGPRIAPYPTRQLAHDGVVVVMDCGERDFTPERGNWHRQKAGDCTTWYRLRSGGD